MQTPTDPVSGINRTEAVAALAYFVLYLAFSFASPGSELRHYVFLVAIPLMIVVALRWRRRKARTG